MVSEHLSDVISSANDDYKERTHGILLEMEKYLRKEDVQGLREVLQKNHEMVRMGPYRRGGGGVMIIIAESSSSPVLIAVQDYLNWLYVYQFNHIIDCLVGWLVSLRSRQKLGLIADGSQD